MRASRVGLLVASVIVGVSAPRAMPAQWGVGGFVGREFDEADNWMFFGADARVPLQNAPVIINPRFVYHSYGSGSTAIQLDVNVLYDFKLANPGLIRPYLGVGGGIVRTSLSSDFGCDVQCSQTKLVADFVAGFKLAFGNGDSPVVPFINTEYSFAKEFTNTYQMSFGIIYTPKKK